MCSAAKPALVNAAFRPPKISVFPMIELFVFFFFPENKYKNRTVSLTKRQNTTPRGKPHVARPPLRGGEGPLGSSPQMFPTTSAPRGGCALGKGWGLGAAGGSCAPGSGLNGAGGREAAKRSPRELTVGPAAPSKGELRRSARL